MDRRDFLKFGTAGIASAGLCLPTGVGAQTVSGPTKISLSIDAIEVMMVDGLKIPMLAFGGLPIKTSRVPGPVLRVKEDAYVEITIKNNRPEHHGFQIAGIAVPPVVIPPNAPAIFKFKAPAAGTYIYHDSHGGTPLHRLLGLHGVLVVEPASETTPYPTPYSLDKISGPAQASIKALFGALGAPGRFPGNKWQRAPSNVEFSTQEKVWVLSSIDPKFNALIKPDGAINISDANALTTNLLKNFVPRYFTLNGRSGFDLHEDKEGQLAVCPANYIGEPTLIRTVNAGLCHHSPHIHGNHVFALAECELDPTKPSVTKVSDNIFELDTWAMFPMQRQDILLPFEVPPDIPYEVPVAKPDAAQAQFKRMVEGKAQEPFPLRYVMHCHTEMSQTAAGGNYPQGMVMHWEIMGGLGGRATAKVASR
jgi:hypothetical protein